MMQHTASNPSSAGIGVLLHRPSLTASERRCRPPAGWSPGRPHLSSALRRCAGADPGPQQLPQHEGQQQLQHDLADRVERNRRGRGAGHDGAHQQG